MITIIGSNGIDNIEKNIETIASDKLDDLYSDLNYITNEYRKNIDDIIIDKKIYYHFINELIKYFKVDNINSLKELFSKFNKNDSYYFHMKYYIDLYDLTNDLYSNIKAVKMKINIPVSYNLYDDIKDIHRHYKYNGLKKLLHALYEEIENNSNKKIFQKYNLNSSDFDNEFSCKNINYLFNSIENVMFVNRIIKNNLQTLMQIVNNITNELFLLISHNDSL